MRHHYAGQHVQTGRSHLVAPPSTTPRQRHYVGGTGALTADDAPRTMVRTVTMIQGRTQVAHPNENLLREAFGHLLRIGVISAVEGPYYVVVQRRSPDRLGGLHNHIWRML